MVSIANDCSQEHRIFINNMFFIKKKLEVEFIDKNQRQNVQG